MPTISNAKLTVTTNRPEDRASVIVSCDVEFTEVEVNAMNVLGLQYTLHCQVLNRELLDEDPVVTYNPQPLPRLGGFARRYEHVTFGTYEPMYLLHDRLKQNSLAETDERLGPVRAEALAAPAGCDDRPDGHRS